MKKYISLFLILILCFSNVLVVKADDSWKTFSQGDPEWGSYVYGGGCTLKSTGCAITGITILMAYANDELRDRSTWNPKIASQKFGFSGAAIYWGTTTNADPTFSIVGGGKQYSGGRLSAEDAKSRVNALLDKDYYVLICTKGLYTAGTHYSPVVGRDGDTPKVWDVAGESGGSFQSWDDWANKGLTEIIAFQSSKQGSSKAFESAGASSTSDKENMSEEEKQELAFKIVSEGELTGMPDSNLIFKDQTNIDLVNRDSLSQGEQEDVENLKQNISSGKKFSFEGLLNSIISFVGMFFIMYGIALFIAYIFDYVNTFIEISVLGIISLGKFRVLDVNENEGNFSGGYNESDGHTYLSKSMLVKRIVVFEIIGMFLVSGLIGRGLSSLYILASDLIH